MTVGSGATTYLWGSAAEYSGVYTSGSLDQTVEANGHSSGSTTVSSGSLSRSVNAGELVYGAFVSDSNPGTTSILSPFHAARATDSSGSAQDTDYMPSASATPVLQLTISNATHWGVVEAVFR